MDTGVNPCMVGPKFFALTSLSRDLHFHGDEFLNIATSILSLQDDEMFSDWKKEVIKGY